MRSRIGIEKNIINDCVCVLCVVGCIDKWYDMVNMNQDKCV